MKLFACALLAGTAESLLLPTRTVAPRMLFGGGDKEGGGGGMGGMNMMETSALPKLTSWFRAAFF